MLTLQADCAAVFGSSPRRLSPSTFPVPTGLALPRLQPRLMESCCGRARAVSCVPSPGISQPDPVGQERGGRQWGAGTRSRTRLWALEGGLDLRRSGGWASGTYLGSRRLAAGQEGPSRGVGLAALSRQGPASGAPLALGPRQDMATCVVCRRLCHVCVGGTSKSQLNFTPGVEPGGRCVRSSVGSWCLLGLAVPPS